MVKLDPWSRTTVKSPLYLTDVSILIASQMMNTLTPQQFYNSERPMVGSRYHLL